MLTCSWNPKFHDWSWPGKAFWIRCLHKSNFLWKIRRNTGNIYFFEIVCRHALMALMRDPSCGGQDATDEHVDQMSRPVPCCKVPIDSEGTAIWLCSSFWQESRTCFRFAKVRWVLKIQDWSWPENFFWLFLFAFLLLQESCKY